MEIGDTICNSLDYCEIGQIKGYILKIGFFEDRIKIAKSNRKHFIDTDTKHFVESRIVLLEKFKKAPYGFN